MYRRWMDFVLRGNIDVSDKNFELDSADAKKQNLGSEQLV